jgi:hypothetical protein
VSRVKTNLDTVLSTAQVSARCFDVRRKRISKQRQYNGMESVNVAFVLSNHLGRV